MGTAVVAEIGGVVYASTSVDADGLYGWDPVFRVPGDDPETPTKEGGVNGDIISFYVTGMFATTFVFQSGAGTPLNLVVGGATAETAIGETQDSDGVVVLPASIVSAGIPVQCYGACLEYDAVGVEVMDVRAGDAPCGVPEYDIDNVVGEACFSECCGEMDLPTVVARPVPRLVGCALDVYQVGLAFEYVEGQGQNTSQISPEYIAFQRGDVKEDGVVNIIDAMYGAQYLVGLRTVGEIRPLNIIDCMYIAQYVVGIRNCYFELAS